MLTWLLSFIVPNSTRLPKNGTACRTTKRTWPRSSWPSSATVPPTQFDFASHLQACALTTCTANSYFLRVLITRNCPINFRLSSLRQLKDYWNHLTHKPSWDLSHYIPQPSDAPRGPKSI